MDFITIPLVVGFITLGIYSVFELLIRRRERLNIIEKLGDKVTPEMLTPRFEYMPRQRSGGSFGALKAAGLLMGIGLGLMVAFFIISFTDLSSNWAVGHNVNYIRELLYGASVLLFGGLGLLVAFIVEVKMRRKEK